MLVSLATRLLHSALCRALYLIFSDRRSANLIAMAFLDDTRQPAYAESSSSVSAQWRNLKEYTKAHSVSSNDCKWLHELVSSDAISKNRISPEYLLRVLYKMTKDASATITEDFGTGSAALLALKNRLASKYVRAVILCHRDSSQGIR